MSGVIVSTADTNVAQAAIGMNAAKTMSFMPGTSEYQFPAVKTGVFATLFPSDNTWHPLYDHNYKEIAGHLFSIEGMNVPPQQKQMYVEQVKDITIESYHVGAMAKVYWALIFVALLLFIKFFFGSTSPILHWMIAGALVIAGCYFIYAEIWAKGTGENYWSTFMSDMQAKLNSGSTPGSILKEYGADESREKDRIAMSNASRGSSGSSSFLGAALGSMAFNAFR